MLWHTGTEAIKALFAPALNKQHMKEAMKGLTNIMASHHDLHVAREPYNPDFDNYKKLYTVLSYLGVFTFRTCCILICLVCFVASFKLSCV